MSSTESSTRPWLTQAHLLRATIELLPTDVEVHFDDSKDVRYESRGTLPARRGGPCAGALAWAAPVSSAG
ncbi:MAG: hypothetical protein I8H67_15820 [Comamonadaceae bacterium]|nr:hypothetical protein [Comamonadaceae bacterium]